MELSSSEESEEGPLLKGLFTDDEGSDNSSEDDSYCASDREWRDAVKAAVETEIQYQVQLRLSLESPGFFSQEKQWDNDTGELLPQLQWRTRRRQRSDSLMRESKILSSANPELDIGTGVVQKRKERELEQPVEEVVRRKSEKKDVQSVYDYLKTKYGTPREQLEYLMKEGRFQVVAMDYNKRIGVDKRVRWPTECNINQGTPKLSSHQLQSKVPFYPDAPLLGLSRPTVHRSPETIAVVYDRVANEQLERDGTLLFESRFESGNLQQAMQVGTHEYDLVLSTDLYTQRHTQWFYFKVSKIEKGATYTFNILNFRKRSSLYNKGMKMLMYSETDEGWTRTGHNISYRKLPPGHPSTLLKQDVEYYYLSWKIEFPHSNDTCYFAHCYPYTFTTLLELLDNYERDGKRRKYFQREVLCETLAGNPCPLITISDFETPEDKWVGRMGVVFSSRIHPGETNSSWMMNGILEYLTSEHKHARYLRSHYVFKLVPMLNPDGVIVGNYRTSLSGVDLNRMYKNPIEKIFPTVTNVKKMIQNFNEERKVVLYVDLHGHSRNYNIFTYGCHTPQCNHLQFLQERVVPWLLSQISKDKFSFKSCKFAVQRCKESTGRVVVWRGGVANSFTMEASFCGTNLVRPSPLHFTPEHLMSTGRELCEVLLKLYHYHKSNSYQFKVHSCIAEHLMKELEKEETSQIPHVTSTLPDIITSTKHRPDEGSESTERYKERRRRTRQQMSKSLQKFHAVSMRRLEIESSTSGSDSDNDEFTYSHSKSRSKHQRQKKHKHNKSHKINVYTSTSQEHKMPKIDTSVRSSVINGQLEQLQGEKEQPTEGKHTNSAPPRLQGATHFQHGWRFVNKYTNRSNGGIPMFSEERMKERAEKKEKLKSVSHIQSSEVTQLLPILASPSTLPSLYSSLSSSNKDHTHLPTLIWKPTDSQQQMIPFQPPEFKLPDFNGSYRTHRERRHSNVAAGSPSSLKHYRQVKGLVESHRRLPTTHSRPFPQMHVNGRPPPPIPAGLPPQLSRYISEIWQKHIGEL